MGTLALHAAAAGSLIKHASPLRESQKSKKALRKNGAMTRNDLEPVVSGLTAKQPFSREQIAVTDAKKLLDSILPYMVKQRIVKEEKLDGRDRIPVKQIRVRFIR